MTHFSTKWKPDKAEKKLATARSALLAGEDVWFFGFCNNLRPLAGEVAVTPLRLVVLLDNAIKFSARYDEIVSFTPDQKKGTIEVVTSGGSMIIKMIPTDDFGPLLHFYEYARITPPPQVLLQAADEAQAATAAAQEREAAARAVHWPNTTIKGRPSAKASEAILRQCRPGEEPWLILTSAGGAGTLVAFDDRLAIIKTGAWTSMAAGSMGGERSATFHFPDVTGIEYNSGFVNGVLEILTASYNGTANRDFWRGSGQSLNANSNNPWTLSNCLPLSKTEYNACLAEINELKARVSRSKHHVIEVNAPVGQPLADLTAQLERLAGLHASGALSDAEFAAAKARLIG